MAQVLKMAQLAQEDGVAQMQIRRRGIEAGFDDERPAGLELLTKVGFGDDLQHPPVDQAQSRGQVHWRLGGKPQTRVRRLR